MNMNSISPSNRDTSTLVLNVNLEYRVHGNTGQNCIMQTQLNSKLVILI